MSDPVEVYARAIGRLRAMEAQGAWSKDAALRAQQVRLLAAGIQEAIDRAPDALGGLDAKAAAELVVAEMLQ